MSNKVGVEHQPVKKLQFHFFFKTSLKFGNVIFFLFTLPGNQKIIFLKALLSRWWFSSFLQVGYVPWRVGFKLGSQVNKNSSAQKKTHEKPEEASLDCSFGMSVGDTQKWSRSVTCSDRIPGRVKHVWWFFGWCTSGCVLFGGVSKGHRFQIDIYIYFGVDICFFGEDEGEFSQFFFGNVDAEHTEKY